MNKEERAAAIAARNETLKTLTPLNDQVCLLDYQADYNLPGMLEAGKTSILGMCRFIQRQIHAPALTPNPLRGHGGCSTFNAVTPEGQIIMGRNFDFKTARSLVVWTHPREGYRSVAMADQNLMLYNDVRRSRKHMRLMATPYISMDGVNEKGLACAILELVAKSTKQSTGKKPITVNVALRGILDTCATVEEAIQFLERYDMHDLLGVCYHYQFTDAQGKSAIVEYLDGKMYVYRQSEKDESLKLTNFYLTPGGKCREMGRDRFERMDCALKESSVMTEKEAMNLLASCKVHFRSRYKVYMVDTLWSAVYNCTEKSMLLCSAADYTHVWRMTVDEPLKAVPVK